MVAWSRWVRSVAAFGVVAGFDVVCGAVVGQSPRSRPATGTPPPPGAAYGALPFEKKPHRGLAVDANPAGVVTVMCG
jgi:hypothetical protein